MRGLRYRRGWVAAPGGASLRYVETGDGPPLVLLHGGLGDYRSWMPHLALLARHYRVIAYSRRYSHASRCAVDGARHELAVDVADLSALLDRLHASPAYLVGTSYGALLALKLALDEPRRARSIVVAEPPLHTWLAKEHPRSAYEQFMSTTWARALDAFAAGDAQRAVTILTDGFGGTGQFSRLGTRTRRRLLQNARAMRILMQSASVFDVVSPADIDRLSVRSMIVCGKKTVPIHRMACALLAMLAPRALYRVVPGVGHSAPIDNPSQFAAQILAFVGKDARDREVAARRY